MEIKMETSSKYVYEKMAAIVFCVDFAVQFIELSTKLQSL
jgi:hypothetical protein